jgi:hypothetical protein
MVVDFKNLRPPASYPVYPPYHKGDYLEEFFYSYYKNNKQLFDQTGYTLIPVYWTNVYITNVNRDLLQPYIDALPQGKYFTVSQHDDAVAEKLPIGTLSFEAGGNRSGIPIPLICSPIDNILCEPVPKSIFCSFVGSIIGGSIRERLYNTLYKDSSFYFSPQHWTPNVDVSRFKHFIDITKQSDFTLCPRGYGAQSFRIYETLQLNSIPVIIYDKEWFPFTDIINWNKFCVLVHISELHILKEKLLKVTNEEKQEMLLYGKHVYNTYFTLDGMCKQILATLQNI